MGHLTRRTYNFDMIRRKHHSICTAWLAACVVLLAALAPTVSHALNSKAAGGLWVEICSSLGARTALVADLPESPTGPDSSLLHSLEHCPLCLVQGSAAAPPPSSISVTLLPLSFDAPLLFLAAPHTLHAWQHALSRGPPSIA